MDYKIIILIIKNHYIKENLVGKIKKLKNKQKYKIIVNNILLLNIKY
jgi:hypothetical protein